MTNQNRSKRNPDKNRTRSSLYDQLNSWFERNTLRWLIIVLAIGLVAGLATFDVKPSTGGDDTSYVLQAMDIVSAGHITLGFRTPGYPIVLALFIWIFGVKLILLKATSLIFFLGTIVSLFFVFRNRLQPMVLYPLLLFVAINPLMLEYAHQTYSEFLFTLLLVWAIHFMLIASEVESILFTILTAILVMVSFYIRVAGITVGGAAILFFVLQRRWKQLGIFILTCIVLYSPMKIYESASGTAAFGQASILLLKNPYNILEGNETFSGFIDRFINNAFNHLNFQIPSALGLPMPQEIAGADGRLIPNAAAFVGILISLVLLAGYISQIITNSKSPLAFLGYFIFAYFTFISLALQNIFATPRMVVPIIPYLFIGTIVGFQWLGNRWAKVKNAVAPSPRAKTLVIVVFVGLTLTNLIVSKKAVDQNIPILKANLAGNELAGFTDDWANYIRAAQWIKSNLPIETTRVICRKPEFFSLYAGNYVLYGAYRIDQVHPDSIVAKWQSLKMTHLLYDNFQWSSTLRRYIQPVAEKYPQIFELVHTEGTQFPSYVFHINYGAISDSITVQKEVRR